MAKKTDETKVQEDVNVNAPEVQEPTPPAPAHRQRVEELVVPTYSLKNIQEGQSVFIEVTSKLEVKEQVDAKSGEVIMDGDTPKTITVCRVTDLDTGVSGEMVVPFMVAKGFELMGDKYVGEHFELVKGAKKNRTNEWFVYRLKK